MVFAVENVMSNDITASDLQSSRESRRFSPSELDLETPSASPGSLEAHFEGESPETGPSPHTEYGSENAASGEGDLRRRFTQEYNPEDDVGNEGLESDAWIHIGSCVAFSCT